MSLEIDLTPQLAAALKQVPSCEFYPLEAVYTNVIGTENTLNAAIANGVKNVIVLSTDKAVYPINAMGLSRNDVYIANVLKCRPDMPKDAPGNRPPARPRPLRSPAMSKTRTRRSRAPPASAPGL